jgi:hypothetical protein
VDPTVSPQGILLRQPNDKAGDARDGRRAAGLALIVRVVLSSGQLACQAGGVASVTGKMPVQRMRGMSRQRSESHRVGRLVPPLRCDWQAITRPPIALVRDVAAIARALA